MSRTKQTPRKSCGGQKQPATKTPSHRRPSKLQKLRESLPKCMEPNPQSPSARRVRWSPCRQICNPEFCGPHLWPLPCQSWAWFLACSVSSHYLKKCWLTINWTLGNKLQWNCNWNSNTFIEDSFENVVCNFHSINGILYSYLIGIWSRDV